MTTFQRTLSLTMALSVMPTLASAAPHQSLASALTLTRAAAPHDLAPPPLVRPAPQKKLEAPIDLANENCPVMGGKADKDVFVDYEGVRVHFCCPGCDKRFLKDPAKYLKVLGIDDLEAWKRERSEKGN